MVKGQLITQLEWERRKGIWTRIREHENVVNIANLFQQGAYQFEHGSLEQEQIWLQARVAKKYPIKMFSSIKKHISQILNN